jgi:uncharacterized protein (DUF849 family)
VPDRILIEAALNGSRGHPAPVAAEAAAAEGRRAVEAGASMVHVHARSADGQDSSDPQWYATFLHHFKSLCPDVPVSFTSKLSGNLPRNVEMWHPAPDFCSINFGSSVDPWPELIATVGDRNIRIEAGIADEDMIDAMCEEATSYFHAVFLVKTACGSRAAAAERYVELRAHAIARKFAGMIVGHGVDDATWGVVGTAAACGDHIRVGFEDSTHLANGDLARSNGDLVTNAVDIATALGRIPLEPQGLGALWGESGEVATKTASHH